MLYVTLIEKSRANWRRGNEVEGAKMNKTQPAQTAAGS